MPGTKRYIQHGRGKYKLVLLRNKRRTPLTQSEPEGALVGELTKRGVWADMAPALAKALHEEEIRRYLALHDWLLRRRDKRIAKNPAGFLAACIAHRLPFPRDFEEARSGVEVATRSYVVSKPVASSNTQVSAEPPDAESASIERELAHLTDAERGYLEAEAVCGAKPFVVSTYERLRREGGALFDEVRRSLLLEHLRQRRVRENGFSDSGLREVG
jgi:hypothetical protein